MAAAAILENRKIVISRQRFDRFRPLIYHQFQLGRRPWAREIVFHILDEPRCEIRFHGLMADLTGTGDRSVNAITET